MKKFLLVTLLVIFSLFGLISAGCGGKGDNQTDPATQSGSEAEPAEEAAVPELLAKGQKIEGMSFDYKMTAQDLVMEGKMYFQGNKLRFETEAEGQNMITIFDGDFMYSYMPEQNMAIKISADQSQKIETPVEYAESVDAANENFEILERTVYQGHKCRVIRVKDSAESKEELKMWLIEEWGIPARVEVTVDGSTSVMEYNNINVGPQPEDQFTIPSGVEVTDMGEMMQQMPQ